MPKKQKWWLIVLVPLIIILSGVILFTKSYSFPPTPIVTPSLTPTDKISGNSTLSRQEYEKMAVADLAERLNVGKEEIKIVDVDARNWADTSLGCPEEGKFYVQVITAGYLIELTANDSPYLYHAGSKRVVTCKDS